jgi:hypothetical protein
MLIWAIVALGWAVIALMAFLLFRLVSYADAKLRSAKVKNRRPELVVVEHPPRHRGRAA